MEKDEAPFAEDAEWNDTDLFAADFTPASSALATEPRVYIGDPW